MTDTNSVVRRYMVFPGCAIGDGKSTKRFWRLLAIREYLAWRKRGRHPRDIATKFEFGSIDEKGDFKAEGRVFHPQAVVRAHRMRENRSWYLPPHQDRGRIDFTRIWQIKGRLNYGRY